MNRRVDKKILLSLVLLFIMPMIALAGVTQFPAMGQKPTDLYFIIPPKWENVSYVLELKNNGETDSRFRIFSGTVVQTEQILLPQEVIPISMMPLIEPELIRVESEGLLEGEFLIQTPDKRTLKVPAFSKGLQTAIFEFYKGPEAEGTVHLANVTSKSINVEIVVRDLHGSYLEEKNIDLLPNQIIEIAVSTFGSQATEYGHDILIRSLDGEFITIQTMFSGKAIMSIKRPLNIKPLSSKTSLSSPYDYGMEEFPEIESSAIEAQASVISFSAPWDTTKYWVPFTYDGHQPCNGCTEQQEPLRAVDFYYAETQQSNYCSSRNPEGGRGRPVSPAHSGTAAAVIYRLVGQAYGCLASPATQTELLVYGTDFTTSYIHSETSNDTLNPIQVGDAVFVSFSAGDSDCTLRLRDNYGLSSNIIGRMYPGQRLIVMDGPSYLNGYKWWKVKGYDLYECLSAQPDGSCVGWAAENAGSIGRRSLLNHVIHKGMQVNVIREVNLRPCPKASSECNPTTTISAGTTITLLNDPSSPTQSESKAASGYRYVWWKVQYGSYPSGWAVDATDYTLPTIGAQVSQGSQIAAISDQGFAQSGPHLHFFVQDTAGSYLPLDDVDPNYIIKINNEVIFPGGLNSACGGSPGYYWFSSMLRGHPLKGTCQEKKVVRK